MNEETVYLLQEYYLQDVESGTPKIIPALKIGFSQNRFWNKVNAGRNESYISCRLQVKILGELNAPRKVEQHLHDLFESYKINNEFFFYSESIVDKFKKGVYYKGTTYKPWIDNYSEVHKQISTFDYLSKIDLIAVENKVGKNANDLYIASLIEDECRCHDVEYYDFSGNIYLHFPETFKPNYIYFKFDDVIPRIDKIIYIRAPHNKKDSIYQVRDKYLNPDILGKEALYFGDMCLNGFIKFDRLLDVFELLNDLKYRDFLYTTNGFYWSWYLNKNKKERKEI